MPTIGRRPSYGTGGTITPSAWLIVPTVALRLGQALAARGDTEAARPELLRALELRAVLDVPDSPWLAEARAILARCACPA